VSLPEFLAVIGKTTLLQGATGAAPPPASAPSGGGGKKEGKKGGKKEAKEAKEAPRRPHLPAPLRAALVPPSNRGCPQAPPKRDKDKEGGKKEGKKREEPAAADKAAAEREKLLKKVIKEGGKKGVEIEGAADMGGLEFFCTTLESPDGAPALPPLDAGRAEPLAQASPRLGP